METLEGVELLGDAGLEGPLGNIADVAEKVFDANLLGFFGFDYRRSVDKGLRGSCSILVESTIVSPVAQRDSDSLIEDIHP